MSELKRTAAQTAVIMAILTLISKCFGFLREIILAGLFGTSYITDAYVMAIAIPGMIFGGIFGAMATAFMPMFSKIKETESKEKANRFTNEAITILILVSIISSIIGLLFSDQIVAIFAGGFEGETAKLTSFFVKITFVYVLFSSTTRILETYLRYHNIFFLPIITGYVQNLIVILCIVISAYYSYYFLAMGWLIAYTVKFFITTYFARRNDLKYNFSIRFGDTAKQITLLTVPVFIGSSFDQINSFIDKTLASGLKEGSVSALNYSYLLVWMIIGLTTSIIMTVLYPKMTKAYSLQDYQYFNYIIKKAFNLICIISIPCSLGALLYSNQIVQIVYERGAFDGEATALTNIAFYYYSAGILFLSLNMLLIKIYYSMHDMKTPVTCSAYSVIINIVLNLILIRFMAHGGLALATSIAACMNTFFLMMKLRKKYPEIQTVDSVKKVITIGILSIISIGISYLSYTIIGSIIWLPRMVIMAITVIIATAVYYLMLKLFKIDELNLLKTILFNRKNI